MTQNLFDNLVDRTVPMISVFRMEFHLTQTRINLHVDEQTAGAKIGRIHPFLGIYISLRHRY